MSNELRAVFEALARTSKTPLTRSRKGNYVWQAPASAWKWFQAGAALRAAPQEPIKADHAWNLAQIAYSERRHDAPPEPSMLLTGSELARIVQLADIDRATPTGEPS